MAVSHNGKWAVVSNYGPAKQPGNSLTVVDLTTRVPTVVRTIDLGEYHRPHGSAFLPGDTALLVTSEVSQAVLVVNIAHGTVSAKIPTTQHASHMVVLTAERPARVYDERRGRHDPELNLNDHSFVRTITVAAAPEGIAVSPSGDQVWVGSDKDKVVSIVTPASGAVADTIGGFGLPYRLAITSRREDRDHH